MPYERLSELPDHVKKLSPSKQRRWRAIFNEVFNRTEDESAAFKAANAIIKEGAMEKDLETNVSLSEAMNLTEIDRDNGIIKNVVLLTGNKTTKNKTFYTDNALKEGVSRYEGAKMFIDHANGNRSIKDLGGNYKNIRIQENYLKADLHLLPNKDITDLIMPLAEAKIDGVGFSIHDRGHGKEKDGVFLVEGFIPGASFSIDLVSDASANRTFFESTIKSPEEDDMKLSEATLENLQTENPTLVESIRTDERAKVMKELEEELKAGKDGKLMLAKADKLMELSQAQFPNDISESIKKIIEAENVTLDQAKLLIESYREIVKKLEENNKKDFGKSDPKVNGHGSPRKDDDDIQAFDSKSLAECLSD